VTRRGPGGLAHVKRAPVALPEVRGHPPLSREDLLDARAQVAPCSRGRENSLPRLSSVRWRTLASTPSSSTKEQISASEIVALGFDETTVRWVLRRVDLNEWKRQQAAPALRVTSKAFGMGRRIPIVQKFVG